MRCRRWAGKGVLTTAHERRIAEAGIGLDCRQRSGIPQEIRMRIFEPFFTTKAPGQGTGWVCRSATASSRRTARQVELESTGPQGTTFRDVLVTLPCAPARLATTKDHERKHRIPSSMTRP
ncbi:MAG: hypothetical protein U1E76_11195 [Planctomycetota bacterium]